jgi:hypothetical protein
MNQIGSHSPRRYTVNPGITRSILSFGGALAPPGDTGSGLSVFTSPEVAQDARMTQAG